jgi:hypothetical protein
MSRIKRHLLHLVLLLILAGTFAWYFRVDLLLDLAAWWAACVSV